MSPAQEHGHQACAIFSTIEIAVLQKQPTETTSHASFGTTITKRATGYDRSHSFNIAKKRCMANVDLNPIRAGMARTPEDSAHTSIKTRIDALKSKGRTPNVVAHQPRRLEPFVGNTRQPMPAGLTYHVEDHFELVDWTG